MTDPEPLTQRNDQELASMSDHDLFAEYSKLEKVIDDQYEPSEKEVRMLAWKERIRVEDELRRRYPPSTEPLPNRPI